MDGVVVLEEGVHLADGAGGDARPQPGAGAAGERRQVRAGPGAEGGRADTRDGAKEEGSTKGSLILV